MLNAETYLNKFSETGRPVYEKAVSLSKERGQFHLGEGHIIIAISVVGPRWFDSMVSQHNSTSEQVLAGAEKHIQSIPIYSGKGLRIHPSAAVFFKDAMSHAMTEDRAQIDALDLLAALDSRIEHLINGKSELKPILIEGYENIKKLLSRA